MSKTAKSIMSLEGAEELNRALTSIGDHATGILLAQAAEAGAKVILEEAKRLVPVDKGDLKESLEVVPGVLKQGAAQMNIGFGKKEFYGQFVELGTEHSPAEPFLRPAFDGKQEEAVESIGDFLRNALKDLLS